MEKIRYIGRYKSGEVHYSGGCSSCGQSGKVVDKKQLQAKFETYTQNGSKISFEYKEVKEVDKDTFDYLMTFKENNTNIFEKA